MAVFNSVTPSSSTTPFKSNEPSMRSLTSCTKSVTVPVNEVVVLSITVSRVPKSERVKGSISTLTVAGPLAVIFPAKSGT